MVDWKEIGAQEDLPPDSAFRSLLPAGTLWTLSSIRIEGALLWIVACIDEDDLWGPRMGVTVLLELDARGTARPVDTWIIFGDGQRVIGTLPHDIEVEVLDFLDCNLEVLLAHWVGDVDSVDLVRRITLPC